MTLLVLAGGKGSRYGSEKQFDPVGPNGEFLLEYALFDAIRAGFKKIVLVTSPSNRSYLDTYLADRLDGKVSFEVVEQNLLDVPEGCLAPVGRLKPLGTAHAVWSARNVIDGPFATVNADDFYGLKAFEQAVAHQHTYSCIAYPLHTTLSENGSVSRGACVQENDSLLKITEYKCIARIGSKITDQEEGVEFEEDQLVSMNMWVLDESVFDMIEQSLRAFIEEQKDPHSGEVYLPDVVQTMINSGIKVKLVDSKSVWFGMTYKEDKAETTKTIGQLVSSGSYPASLWT